MGGGEMLFSEVRGVGCVDLVSAVTMNIIFVEDIKYFK